MKLLAFAIAVLASASTWAGEVCEKELKDKQRAEARAADCQKALNDYESKYSNPGGGDLAPLVPIDQDKQYLQLKSNLEAALRDKRLNTEAYDKCRRTKCKKPNLRWGCVANWDYDRCCMDGKDSDGSAGSGKK